ncbi:D-amino-acid dehydrogenase [Exophiala viscosa]|uniref:D-amino-acid dehydrogenase n=1 Tax=Exophiala viscosa TaxID=2486360 RepID=A0AAN6E0N0_9EURO|nr:D-amino-acid dehydrogenase [Exophiala viscosa]
MSNDDADNDAVVILGGGIIGLSIAYHLSKSADFKRHIHIIDSASKLLESASGYAGGFLARDWFRPESAALGELSFELHRQLADAHGGHRRWGYAGSHVYSMSLHGEPEGSRVEDWLLEGTSRAAAVGRRAEGHVSAPGEQVNDDGTPAWMVTQDGASWNVVSGAEDCAQVEPRRLCEFLVEECRRRGVEMHLSTRATGVITTGDGKIVGVETESTDQESGVRSLRCSDIVVAAGCWTPRIIETLFPRNRAKVEIDPLAGHSILYRTPRYAKPFGNVACGQQDKFHGKDENIAYAFYCPPTESWSWAPEAYARLNADSRPEIWVGGLNHDETVLPLPELATDTKKMINRESLAELRKVAVTLTGLKQPGSQAAEDDLEVEWEGLCFRPVSRSGVPIIGQILPKDLGVGFQVSSGAKVWVASGHGPWGISLSLGTGVVMGDLINGHEPRVDISGLKPESRVSSKL